MKHCSRELRVSEGTWKTSPFIHSLTMTSVLTENGWDSPNKEFNEKLWKALE